jgi:hypothetical protein
MIEAFSQARCDAKGVVDLQQVAEDQLGGFLRKVVSADSGVQRIRAAGYCGDDDVRVRRGGFCAC